MIRLSLISIIILLCLGKTNAGHKRTLLQDSTVINLGEENNITIETEDDKKYVEEFNKDVDTTLYFNNLTVNPDSIEALKNSKSFAYVKTLDRLLKERQDNYKPPKPRKKNIFWANFFSSTIIKSILWAIGISFVVFLLYHLFLADGIFKKSSVSNKNLQPQVEEEILLANSDFNALIEQALRTNNYRLAIRYHYLKSLQLLSNNGLVQIAPDKTNYQYVREINNYEYQNNFSSLTLHYEYVWYGEFNIDEIMYKKIEIDFNQFNKNFK